MYVSANEKDKHGWANRIFSFCGGIGTTDGPELPAGRWSFPLSINKTENYPLLENGELNSSYDPNEAEEIIVAKWATTTGITVTRTSRAWSYPDYDDMIIYEYSLEYTGDTDGNPATIERTTPLVDVLFHINYGFAPSMLGYQRNYYEWKYEQGLYRQDNRSSFDPDYWLTFMQTIHTGAYDAVNEFMAFKPEPNKALFKQFAETGMNGGGLLSPQAPGYCWLYWDIDHLAVVDPIDRSRNESDYADWMMKDASGNYYETDVNGHILQPWNMKTESGNTRPDKMEDRAATLDERWWTVYGELGVQVDVPSDQGRFILPGERQWLGRARYEWDESYNGIMIINGFGPYNMNLGDKLEFAYAEVVGYGATNGKVLCGGQTANQFSTTRSMDRKVVVDGITYTEHYLTDYGYPDYINSKVISVNQVAHNAWESYLGETIPYDTVRMGPACGMLFPELNPSPSTNVKKYKNIPIPVPAPVIVVSNTDQATVDITWKRSVEHFNNPRPMGVLEKFNIYRSNSGAGPWSLIGSLDTGNVNANDMYEFIDEDESYKLGEKKYYSVTSVDDNGNESGRTNITEHIKNPTTVDEQIVLSNKFRLEQNYPNPFNPSTTISFSITQLGHVSLRIFDLLGRTVATLLNEEKSAGRYSVTWDASRFPSGVYLCRLWIDNNMQTKRLVLLR